MKSRSFHRTVGAISAAAVAALPLIVPATASADPVDCAPVQLIQVPGTWETASGNDPSAPAGLLTQVEDSIDPEARDNVDVTYLAYDARFGDGVSFEQSRSNGLQALHDTIEGIQSQCGDEPTYFVTGFSQGASVAGDFASDVGNGRATISPDQLIGVGLVADGERSPEDTLVGEELAGAGLLSDGREGGFGSVKDRTFQFCDPLDMVCNADVDPYAQKILGKMASSMNAADPAGTVASFQAILQEEAPGLLAGDPAALMEAGPRFASLATALRDYLIGFTQNAHTRYGTNVVDPKTGDTVTSWMGEIVSQAAKHDGAVKPIRTPGAPEKSVDGTPGTGLAGEPGASAPGDLAAAVGQKGNLPPEQVALLAGFLQTTTANPGPADTGQATDLLGQVMGFLNALGPR